MKRVLIVAVIGLLVLFAFGCGSTTTDNGQGTPEAAQSIIEALDEMSDDYDSSGEYDYDTSGDTAVDTSTGSWQKVITIKGDSSSYKSRTFTLSTSEQKAVVTNSSSDPEWASTTAYLMVRGDEGYYEQVNKDGNGKGSSFWYAEPGQYYIEMNTCNCSWTVTIFER